MSIPFLFSLLTCVTCVICVTCVTCVISATYIDIDIIDHLRRDIGTIGGVGVGQVPGTLPVPVGAVGICRRWGGVSHTCGGHDANRFT